MLIRNENASCGTCRHRQSSPRAKNCKRCANQNGYPGWEPAPGVAVQEVKGWTFTRLGKPVETLFRKVVGDNVKML